MKEYNSKRKAQLFSLGRKVNFAMPRPATLRPTDVQMKIAAQSLGITQAEAWRAWTEYTWDNKSEKRH